MTEASPPVKALKAMAISVRLPTTTKIRHRLRYFLRQYQRRRRDMTSSSRSSRSAP